MASSSGTASGDVWDTPELSADHTEAVSKEALVGFEHLPIFDVRNGNVKDARSMLVRPTIPECFHWAPVGGTVTAKPIAYIDAFIRCARYQLDKMTEARPTDAVLRKMAIILGTARCVMTTYYGLTPADLIGGELAPTYLNVVEVPPNGLAYRVTSRATGGNVGHLTTAMGFSTEEHAVISTLLTCSIGIIPVQGFSLMQTGHHYISQADSQSRKAYLAIERQFWRSNAVTKWFTDDLTVIQDTLWHKAGHPVSLTVKYETAANRDTAEMLKAAGAGSAAARLPAIEPALRAAGSYMALFKTVDPLLRMFGGKADLGVLPEMVRLVTDWNPTEVKQGPQIPPPLPLSVTTREEGVSLISSLLSANAGQAAWLFGFYCALTDANALLATGGANDTLKTSASLIKLRSNCMAAYITGTLDYQNFAAARAAQRQSGEFKAPDQSFRVGTDEAAPAGGA